MLTWLSSSIGKLVAKWAAFAAVAIAVYWNIYADGRADQGAKQVAEQMHAPGEREKINDQVSKLPADRVRDELYRWVRNDG
ncbi:hypothetical protein ACTJK5_10825 [Agrobacterium sp. 22094]|uniref:hypothetical protein n=1 Tax=Agrobacterium sp. 22094 TaxID=3453872 RepID=UPI003F84FAB4